MMTSLVRRLSPRASFLNHRLLRGVSRYLDGPSFQQVDRSNFSRGVALGLFLAFAIPFGQIAVATLLSLKMRANVAVAAVATLVSNPITIPVIYYGAYKLGEAVLQYQFGGSADLTLGGESVGMSTLAPTALGLAVFAATAAAIGFLAARAIWQTGPARRWSGA